jgi:hypothetical protein
MAHDLDRIGDNVTAWSLAAEVPHLGMWGSFAEHQFSRWAADLGAGAPRVAGRYTSGRSERPDAGRELCTVTITGVRGVACLTLRLRDRWRVAGLGHGVLQPGWPARWIDLEEGVESVLTSTSPRRRRPGDRPSSGSSSA